MTVAALALSPQILSGATVNTKPNSLMYGFSRSDGQWWPVCVEDLEAIAANTNTANGLSSAASTYLQGIKGDTDNLESLLTTLTINDIVQLAAINANTDMIETSLTATNTKLDTLIGQTDGVETLITATNTKLDALLALEPPSNASETSASVLLLGTSTIKASAGTAYAITATNTVELRNNGATRCFISAGYTKLPRPMAFATNIQVYGLVAASFTIWWS